MRCPKCGKEIADDSKFCEFCGAKISSPKRIKVLWIVLVVLFGLSALGVGSFYVYDMYKQHEKEVAEARAAQEDAERQAEEAKQKQMQAEKEATMAQEAKIEAEREKAKAEKEACELRRLNEEKLRAEKARKEKEAREAVLKAQAYIDLGLPSGTKWRNQTEAGGFYTYEEAMSRFRNELPTKEQWMELKKKCIWTWTDKGYKVVGPNGNSIFLPAKGWRNCNGSTDGGDMGGLYYSSTPGGSEGAWILYFDSDKVDMGNFMRCFGSSIRLVQNSNKSSR